MSIWKGFKDKLGIVQEQYGLGEVLYSYSIVENIESGKGVTYRYSNNGRGDPSAMNKFLNDKFGPPVSINEDANDITRVFANNTTYLNYDMSNSRKEGLKKLNIMLITTDYSILEDIKKQTSLLIEETAPSNSVFALVTTPNGLSLTTLGEFKQELLSCNYTSQTIQDYNHIKECLSSKEPCGRLILLQGSPGTGKSYMIRSLVSTINSTFIVVGSDMISDLSGPAILPVLLGAVDLGKPITFILEDADVALTTRNKGSMTNLSGLLNLGDGLLGEMLDIRIIATTNAGSLELDKAVTRPGRMCKHIAFDSLSAEDATSLYHKLVDSPTETIKTPLTLAEIYRLARQDGWVASKTSESPGQYL